MLISAEDTPTLNGSNEAASISCFDAPALNASKMKCLRAPGSLIEEKTRLLILVGIFSAIREPGALRHFISEAFKAGASKQEIEAASLLPFSVGVSSAEMSIQIIVEMAK